MGAEVIAAIIAVSGVVLSAIVSFLVSQLTLKYNYKQLYAEHVSDNRMEWINVWRESLSQMLACADMMHKYGECSTDDGARADGSNLFSCYKEFCFNRNKVITRLNMTEDLHKLLFAALNTLDYNSTNYIAEREYIIDIARKILKPEWERVKLESKGKKHKGE